MKFLIATVVLISTPAFASTKAFDIKAELSLNGKLVSKPHIITKANELASIEQTDQNNHKTIIEVVASDYTSDKVKNGIQMNFTVSRIENGQKNIISKPQIIAAPGEVAEIAVGEKANPDLLRMTVIAKRVQ